ncbi:DNA-directed RNA polymerase subunit beta [Saliterribacillus persicus]|uniref:DNA-directed RNA polymerase subunit beta n=1 Tax=Saliterribacillus persicus TaxID=930114 RepID=A0A368YDJ6_9BACI|nr:DNA-directed RNA polymerase subunit beta [Saliterribacillus persicus]RCW77416.1 DNA-directed RNA polymerase subunit beta [Saliterribacillus persicus]
MTTQKNENKKMRAKKNQTLLPKEAKHEKKVTKDEKAEKKQSRQEKKQQKKAIRRVIPIWLKLLILIVLCLFALLIGLIVGFSILGDGSPLDVLRIETWQHIIDIVLGEG